MEDTAIVNPSSHTASEDNLPSRLPLQMGVFFSLLVVVSSSLTGIGVPVTIMRSLVAFVLGLGLGFALLWVIHRIQTAPPAPPKPAKPADTLPVTTTDQQDQEHV